MAKKKVALPVVENVVEVPVEQINLPPTPPAKGIVTSRNEIGQVEPVQLKPERDEAGAATGRYNLITGSGRIWAALEGGYQTVNALIRDIDSETALLYDLASNHRARDNAAASARKLRELVEDYGLSQKEIAERANVSQGKISQYMVLNTLHPLAFEMLADGRMPARAGYHMTRLPQEVQAELCTRYPDGITIDVAKAAVDAMRQQELAEAKAAAAPEHNGREAPPREQITLTMTDIETLAMGGSYTLTIPGTDTILILHAEIMES